MRSLLFVWCFIILGATSSGHAADWNFVEPQPNSNNYYERLGIDPSDPNLSDPEVAPKMIKAAYLRAARKHHPDHFQGEAADVAKALFQKIEMAYATLKDVDQRHFYDQFKTNHGQSAGGDPFGKAGPGWDNWADWFKSGRSDQRSEPRKRNGPEAKSEAVELLRQAIRDSMDISRAQNLFEEKLKADSQIYQETFVKLVKAMALKKKYPRLSFDFPVDYPRWYSLGDDAVFGAFDEILKSEAAVYAASRPTAEQLLEMEVQLQDHFRHLIPMFWEMTLSDLESGPAARKLLKAYAQAVLTSDSGHEALPERLGHGNSEAGAPREHSRTELLQNLLARFGQRFDIETGPFLTEVVEEKLRKDLDVFHFEHMEEKTQEALATWEGAWEIIRTLPKEQQIKFLETFADHFYTDDAWPKETYRNGPYYRGYPLKTAILQAIGGFSARGYIGKISTKITEAVNEFIVKNPGSVGDVLNSKRLSARLKAHFAQGGEAGREARCGDAFHALVAHRRKLDVPRLTDLENL